MDLLAKQRRAIRQAMTYAVPEGRLQEAMDLIDRYRNDPLGLQILQEFYSYLPEATEACVEELLLIARKRGVHLMAVRTDSAGYLYLVSDEGIEFHGRLDRGYLEPELLEFFDFAGEEEFRARCLAVDDLAPYEPMQVDGEVCPICHVSIGECHELGCPVEICPWCGGQLINCNCRFDKLGLDFLTTEEELCRFEEMLEAQGRIAYAPEQRPDFIDDGGGILVD
jgi:hypothetical protein